MTIYAQIIDGKINNVSSIQKEDYLPFQCLDDDFFQFWPYYKIEGNYAVFDIETYFKPAENQYLIQPTGNGKYVLARAKVERRDSIPFDLDINEIDNIKKYLNYWYDVDLEARTVTLNQTKKDNYQLYMEYKQKITYLAETDWIVLKRIDLGEERHPDIASAREAARVRINQIQALIDISLYE